MKRRIAAAIAVAFSLSLVSCARAAPSLPPKPDQGSMLELAALLAPCDDARIAGSAGEKAAAELLRERFRSLGLETEIEEFPILTYKPGTAFVEFDGKILPAIALTYSPSTPEKGISASIAYGGQGLAGELAGVSGKIALVRRGQIFFKEKAENAAAAGALAMIAFEAGRGEFEATMLGPGALPSLTIAGETGTAIAEALARGEEREARLVVTGRNVQATSRNLTARAKGAGGRSSGALIIGAHLDSVSTPGALDNASGLACLVELARVLSGRRMAPDLYFVGFGAEELGDLGSRRFVETWKGPRIRAMIALDTVGSGSWTSIYSSGGERNEAVLAAAAAAAELGYRVQEGASDASDHVPFAYSGIPAIFLMREPEDRYHTDLDQVSALSGPAMGETVEIAARAAIRLAELSP